MLSPVDPAQPYYGYQPASYDAPVVSIITPYYNTGPVFMETVQSVLRQSLQQWEWIIVNDGSDDPIALRTLLPLRSADGRIKVLDQPNRGLPAARNAGVKASRAALLFFLDSDDLIAPTMIEKLAWTLETHPHSSFSTGWTVVFGAEDLLWPRGFDLRHAFVYENQATPQSMVRRSVFDRVGGFDESRRQGLEDYEFWLRCAAHGFWGHDVHEYLVWVRRKALQEYTAYRWSVRDDPQAYRAFRREMRERYPDLFREGVPRVSGDGALLDTHALVTSTLPFHNCLQRPPGQRRVLLLLYPYAPAGGSEQFAQDLLHELVAHGDRVSVCLMRTVGRSASEQFQRVTSDVFDLATFLDPGDYPRFLHYLIDSRQISTVLLTNSLLAYRLLPYLRTHCPQVAVVDYLHMEQEHWHHGGFPRAAVEHDSLVDLHIVSSQHLRRWMIEHGAEADRIEICTTNIDTREWFPSTEIRARIRSQLGIPADLPLILFVGRLVSQKRPRLVVEILHQLHKSGTPFISLIIGDGEDRRWLQYYVRSHSLSEVIRLVDPVPHDRMREIFAASDLLLLPSEYEGIALVLYEALAMGVVPVAADVGGHAEVVTPECGILIPHSTNEIMQYVHALRQLIEDPAMRVRMASAGRARVVANFSTEQMLDRMKALLDLAEDRARAEVLPPVSAGLGLATASLAMEHYQLEIRLRAMLPVRAVLSLRRSSAWGQLGRLRDAGKYVEKIQRILYATRRTLSKGLQRIRGRTFYV